MAIDMETLHRILKDVGAGQEPSDDYTDEMKTVHARTKSDLALAKKKKPNVFLHIPPDGQDGMPGPEDFDKEDHPTIGMTIDSADEPRDENGRWTDGGGGSGKMSADEGKAVHLWTTQAYEGINKKARSGKADATVQRIDSAIARSRAPKDLEVYRASLYANRLANSRVGDTFSDKGFVSTTDKRDTAEWFGRVNDEGDSKAAIITIRVPKGSPILPIKSSAMDGEHELLLPRGSRFRIVDKGTTPQGRLSITAEVVQ